MPPTTIKPSARCCGNCTYWEPGQDDEEVTFCVCSLFESWRAKPRHDGHSGKTLPEGADNDEVTAYMANEYAMPLAADMEGLNAVLVTPAHFSCRLWAEAQPEPSDDANAD